MSKLYILVSCVFYVACRFTWRGFDHRTSCIVLGVCSIIGLSYFEFDFVVFAITTFLPYSEISFDALHLLSISSYSFSLSIWSLLIFAWLDSHF